MLGKEVMSTKTAKPGKQIEANRGNKMPRKNSNTSELLKPKTTRLSRRVKKSLNVEKLNEQNTQYVEKYIPTLAKNATVRAYRRALTSGSRVVIAEGGELKEVLPDGTRRTIKKIEPAVKMQKGQIIKIK